MYTDDLGYMQLPESVKHYSIQKHRLDNKMAMDQTRVENEPSRQFFRGPPEISKQLIDCYWEKGLDFSIIDVGAQYGIFSMDLANYIKAHGHHNKIYAFDCGIAGQLTQYNIKLNQLEDFIKFEYKAVSNASIPHLLYHGVQHSEDNHIVRRAFVDLPSYIVDGVTLDDYFENKIENLIIKVDVQGAEPLVFEGMQRLLGNKLVTIIFEFTPWAYKLVKDPLEFLNILPENHLLFNISNKKGRLSEINRTDFANFIKEISATEPYWTDLLLVSEAVAESVASRIISKNYLKVEMPDNNMIENQFQGITEEEKEIKQLLESNKAMDAELKNSRKELEVLKSIRLDHEKNLEEKEIKQLLESNKALELELRNLQTTLSAIHQSKTWRLLRRYDSIFHKVNSKSTSSDNLKLI